MRIYRRSPLTGQKNYMDLPITIQQFSDWQSGTLIQDAMPHLDSSQREFLVSGCLPGEFESIFSSISDSDEQEDDQ